MEIRLQPQCHFTLRSFPNETCHSDIGLGVFKPLLDEWIKFGRYEEFDVIEAKVKFERVYREIPDAHLLFQNDEL